MKYFFQSKKQSEKTKMYITGLSEYTPSSDNFMVNTTREFLVLVTNGYPISSSSISFLDPFN